MYFHPIVLMPQFTVLCVRKVGMLGKNFFVLIDIGEFHCYVAFIYAVVLSSSPSFLMVTSVAPLTLRSNQHTIVLTPVSMSPSLIVGAAFVFSDVNLAYILGTTRLTTIVLCILTCPCNIVYRTS